MFNRLGEIAAQYLRKGSQVYIEGSLRTRKWQDQNGQDRYTTEIRADQMQMLGGGSDTGMGGGGGFAGGQQPQGGGYGNQTGGAAAGGFGAQNQGGQQGYGNQGFQQGGNAAQGAGNNQNTFAPHAPAAPQPQQQPQQTPEFNNHTTIPAGGMTDTPKDDDIPF